MNGQLAAVLKNLYCVCAVVCQNFVKFDTRVIMSIVKLVSARAASLP